MSRIRFPDPAAKKQIPAPSGPLRLGEMLVEANLLTTEQVNEAIEAQYLYGSRLGTSLVDLGFIDEMTIAIALSQKLHLPYIEPEDLMDIPEEVLALVPAELAAKHQVVPCELDGKKLYLAMADPTNLATIDELSFRLNLLVVPVVVPEIRLMFALYKFYQVKLTPRLQILSRHMLQVKVNKAEIKSSPWQEKELVRPVTEEENRQSGGGNLKIEKLNPSSAGNAFSGGNPGAAKITRQPNVDSPGQAPVKNSQPQSTFNQFCDILADAKERDEIASIVLSYLGRQVPSVALLTVRSGQMTGWRAVSGRKPVQGFNQLVLNLNQGSTLRKVAESRIYYLGKPTLTEQDAKLSDFFAAGPGTEILLVPLVIKNRLAGMIYLQGERDALTAKLDEVHQLATKVSMAFEILILRGKIRSA